MRKYLVDTNVILDSFDILSDNKYVVSSHTLREIEKHEHSNSHELSLKARRVKRYLNENSNISYDLKDYIFNLNEIFDNYYEDNRMLQACVESGYGLVTNDILLKMKAEGFGIEVIAPSEDDNKVNMYKGYKEVSLSSQDMAAMYQDTHENVFNLIINQYLLVRDANGNVVDRRKWNGRELVGLKLPPSKVIKPWNDLQAFSLDLLNDTSVPIRIISGTYGSGKTMLAINMGLHHIRDKGNYSKIMAIRNPIGSGEAIGFLKGTKEDKIGSFFKPIEHQLSGGEFELQAMIQKGQLECEVPFFMKGMSLNGGYFIIVDEAQDMDLKTLKLIGTRIGRDSSICLCGDYKQAENKFLHNNGLFQAINKLKGNPLVGIVVMDEDVRSDASKVFADLD